MTTWWEWVGFAIFFMALGGFIVRCLQYGTHGGPIRPDGVD